jgi:hypothetical protein
MLEISGPLPSCQYLNVTTVGHLSRIIMAMLAMIGRVTMLGLARYAGTGGNYRTVQRFFPTVIAWLVLFCAFFRQPVLGPFEVPASTENQLVVSGRSQTSPLPRLGRPQARRIRNFEKQSIRPQYGNTASGIP